MGENMESIPCLRRIHAMYTQFSEKERKIADYITNYPNKVIHSTISQVAEDMFVADATVFRFCKRIGFNGFQAMKIALASEISTPVQDIFETIQETDSEKEIAEKVFKSNMNTLQDTMHTFNENSFHHAVHIILNARRIEFYGNGGSGIIALDAQHKFLRTGLQTVAYTDTHLQMMSASQLTPQDVAIIISYSGSNKDMLQLLEVVKESGAKSIGITNFAKSPLSQKVDVPLFTTSCESDFRSGAISARVAQLSLIDALYVNVMTKGKEKSEKILNKIGEALSLRKM
ncbi:MurR/RpiR family transcriptional regulator [Bacillus ginsengihumi]|uniref:RpiR family transcriptional regulator n=1 Tax=Heyndrickxia ginsengihumi TaxID=363870 RepID=A0A0A6VAU6_9BACI|nr:MurR/RpiR family transcriptional regulator [Heyndrickxia ginsengihumi]KHD84628.1 RpiR family transcriptional regulator [Heyndrickxia ginsengihumi]MBE6185595.1 MurR/RpiR family transcriptional regulator [Bacillus sp. (in: firmicutes)]MCM3024977.1 MurR/RpiR family transcriptional regulator [Heyndrickxia ginsengihumi]NEY19112.1 MurR/RpiR family transcriptional regulator [Heyndrickxia ginsengihumi]